jgi:hypothetical protein
LTLRIKIAVLNEPAIWRQKYRGKLLICEVGGKRPLTMDLYEKKQERVKCGGSCWLQTVWSRSFKLTTHIKHFSLCEILIF